jgi:NAD(P)-dependent dehydrogenase (short-subunit alcohol dehydrogenase family)
VIGMVRAVALDLAARRVRVSAICPGFIETELAREVAGREPDPEAALTARRGMHPTRRRYAGRDRCRRRLARLGYRHLVYRSGNPDR